MKTIFSFFLAAILFSGCNRSGDDHANGNGNLNDKAVGASANDLLSSSKYTSLKIEVQYMPGYQPDDNAIKHLQQTFADILNKPSGITVVTKEIPASAGLALSLTDVTNIEKANRTAFTSGTELAIYVLYTNGNYTDDKVLGIAYKNTSVVLFGKKIADNSNGIGQPSRTKLVATVAEHEMGHLLGLVDLGSSMQTAHKDATHGNHCDNTNCLMYYQAETTDILGFLNIAAIPPFDANCRADLTANGGK